MVEGKKAPANLAAGRADDAASSGRLPLQEQSFPSTRRNHLAQRRQNLAERRQPLGALVSGRREAGALFEKPAEGKRVREMQLVGYPGDWQRRRLQ